MESKPAHGGYPTIPPISQPFQPTLDIGNQRVLINGPDDESYDLVVICRYITQMHRTLKRMEPVINDIADFAEFMREFKDYAKDDLATLSRVLKNADDAKED